MSRTRHHRNQNWSWSTPSQWVNMMMTRPQRAKVRKWKVEAKQTKVEELDGLDLPAHGKKPHVYYW